MLTRENIVDGQLIFSNWQRPKQKITVGIIKNVRQVNPDEPKESNPELQYDIYYPISASTAHDVKEKSGVSAEAEPISSDIAQLFFKKLVTANSAKIISLKTKNIGLKKGYQEIFSKPFDTEE